MAYCIGVNTASLTAVAGGGTPGYSYEWDDNGVVPQTTTTATGLNAGTYSVIVTDVNGCTTTSSATITDLPDGSIKEKLFSNWLSGIH